MTKHAAHCSAHGEYKPTCGACRVTVYRHAVTAERRIEIAIGLFDEKDIPRGQYPPRLAAAIVQALRDEGYVVRSEVSR